MEQTLLEKAAAEEKAKEDSFERSDTDGFLSQWAHGLHAELYRKQAEIEANGGLHSFPAILDVAGKEIPSRLIDGKYGACFALVDSDGKFTGSFLPWGFTERSKWHKAGYRFGSVDAPAKAKIWAPKTAKGLAGATQVRVVVERIYKESINA